MFTTSDALPRALPQVGGAPFSGAFKAIADTGTSLLALPKADLGILIAKLPGVKELPGTGEYLIPDCTKVGGGGGQPPTPPPPCIAGRGASSASCPRDGSRSLTTRDLFKFRVNI